MTARFEGGCSFGFSTSLSMRSVRASTVLPAAMP